MIFEIRNEAGEIAHMGDDRKAALDYARANLPAGTYTLYKNMGSFTIEERTEAVVRRTRFESTTKRPRAAKEAAPPPEPPVAEAPRRGGIFGR